MKADLGGAAAAFEIEVGALGLTPAGLAVAMGYRGGKAPDPFASMIAEVLELAPAQVACHAGFRVMPATAFSCGTGGFELDGTWFAADRLIAAGLRGATTVAVFVASAGQALDDWSKQHNNSGDLVTAFVIDCLGSVIAEAAADWVEARVVDRALAAGMGCSSRFSPGYCGWSVAEQQQLFALLPERFCGVSLTESSLMLPIKSVSGVIGIGPGLRKQAYGCSACEAEHCYRRRDVE